MTDHDKTPMGPLPWIIALMMSLTVSITVVWLDNVRKAAKKTAEASITLHSPNASGGTISVEGCGKAVVTLHRLGLRLANQTYTYKWDSINGEFDVKLLNPNGDKVEITAKDPEGTQGFGAFTPLTVTEQPGGLELTGWTVLHGPIDKLETELATTNLIANGEVQLKKGNTYILTARTSFQFNPTTSNHGPEISWDATGGVTVSKLTDVTAMLDVPSSHPGGEITVVAKMCGKEWLDVVAGGLQPAKLKWVVR